MLPLAWSVGLPEMLVIGTVALIVFGRRLPDIARSMGRSIVEFKKGLNDVSSDVDRAGTDRQLPPPSAQPPGAPPADTLDRRIDAK